MHTVFTIGGSIIALHTYLHNCVINIDEPLLYCPTDPVDQVPDISKRSTLEVAAPRLRRRSLEDRKKFYYVL